MTFDPLSWAISFALNTMGKITLERFKGLNSDLVKAVEKWKSGLPDELHFTSEALFSPLESEEDIEQFPHRYSLIESFKKLHIPSQQIWFNALFEQWKFVKERINDAQPFFLQPHHQAEEQLKLLSVQLESVCKKNQELFQGTVLEDLSSIKDLIKNSHHEKHSKRIGEIDVLNGMDNHLIVELAVAGYVNESSGIHRAIYLDKDHLYVNRNKAEKALIDKVFAYSNSPQENNQWISIVGDAGQGKSSLVWYLFNRLKNEGLEIYCILAQMSGAEILNRLEAAYPFFKRGAIIILDTLDLIVGIDNSRLSTIIGNIRRAGHLLVTTCRRQEIRSIQLRCDIEIELGLYTDGEARQAIEYYIETFYATMSEHQKKVQFNNIWNILDAQRRIKELDLDPLILSMIFQAYFPENITQDINTQKIYDYFWQKRVLEDRNPTEEEKRIRIFLCLLLARCIFSSQESSDSLDIEELDERWRDSRKGPFPIIVLEKLVSSGILHWACGRVHVRFFHQTFLEYTIAMDIRLANDSARNAQLSELYVELKSNISRRNPILKQVAVQDFFAGGHLWLSILETLDNIHSLLALQIALEILGKIGSDYGRAQQLCHTWIAEDPPQVATTVCETIKHYPKSKIPVALNLLEPCLQSHEEIAIYTACSDKLALMDADSVYTFLRKRIPYLAGGLDNPIIDDRRSRIRESMVSVFACGVNRALNDLFVMFPALKSGQRAGLISGIEKAITQNNASDVVSFCKKIVGLVIDSEEGEVRYSFITLLERLQKFAYEDVRQLCQSIYDSGIWKNNPKAAAFTGSIVGRFLLDISKIRFFVSNIESPDPHLRLVCAWALKDAHTIYHEVIIEEVINIVHPNLSQIGRQMIFKVIANLDNASQGSIFKLLEICPWPSKVELLDEFNRIWSHLSEMNESELKKWLMEGIKNTSGVRYRQIYMGLLVLILKNISLFNARELRSVYELAYQDEFVIMKFAHIAGRITFVDQKLASEIFDDLLQYPKQQVRTSAIKSLIICVNDHLLFTLGLGDSVLTISGKRDRYGLIHVYLEVLQEYSGNEGVNILLKINGWFNEQYLNSLEDETAVVRLLTLLKIHAINNPVAVFQIANRCRLFTQGVAGALAAVYANVSVRLSDKNKLFVILNELVEIIKTQTGRGQRRIRQSLRMAIPFLVRKLGPQAVFDVFFDKYKEIASPHALEDLVRPLVVLPEWSDTERNKLLNDVNLPPQVRSIVLAKG